LGVDIIDGPGVDEICDIGDVVARFGESSFDVIISTEVIEHVRDWRTAVSNLKRAVRPQGLLFITTRSRGFHRHAWPQDWWRYELQDMETIFQDMTIEALESDPQLPGVFLKAAKPQSRWPEKDLSSIRLYSMVGHRRVAELSKMDLALDVTAHKIARFFLPQRLKETIKEHILREGS
jgi:SAM-dependent methyltransferase